MPTLNDAIRLDITVDEIKSAIKKNKLKIATSSVGETKETSVDLVETFNYLLGLVVESIKFDNGFLTIYGKNLKNSKILIIWREDKTSEELDKFVEEIELNSFDEVYLNGDSNLENVKLIEQEFKRLMSLPINLAF